MSLTPTVTSPYSPTDSVVTVNNVVGEAFSSLNAVDSTESRTDSCARVVLLDYAGKEVVLTGDQAREYLAAEKVLNSVLPAVFFGAMEQMMLDPEISKYFEDAVKERVPLQASSRVQELNSVLETPNSHAIRV